MKKIYTLLSILLLTVLLAACGTSTATEDQDETQVTGNENTEQTTSPEETENNEAETDASQSTTSPEKVLEGTTTESDSQNYSITVMEGYELTGEEPNKDLLFNLNNDLQSMRIETFSADEATIEVIKENLIATLQASNESATVTEIKDKNLIPTKDFIENTSSHQIDTPEGKVSGYVFEREGLIVKLTVFDTVDSPALETFVQMAETIKAK
ncbi:hypothetical protein KD050_16655 [Psychrobacillus sp. INOP01]|uniref:hypothetical protein n=1 Tax=Psychrobacillus sp. INOP01 TaxID=2829187 RepID=UPI001BA48AA6|nr:hypothetical protein [Psychrobacillus sp. INOP01]QUG40904.1 hypothetical protein KD050_16655 [Psychrobacillus sp. INOP01]